jgi:tripartite-type tricarboxylate transporter receptor subunit TctC
MSLARRQFLQLAAAAVAAPTMSSVARAQAYPARPVRIIVGFPAGGTTDIVARLVGQWLTERLGQPFVIENRPGANTNLATEAVVRAPADGHTILLTTMSNVINVSLYDKLGYDFTRDIAPVASVMRTPLVLEVIPAVPVNTVPEFIAHAKANLGKIAMASFGNGSLSHLSGELFKMMTGVDMVHVPYRGSAPMLTDMLAGHVHVAFDNIPASIAHIRAGKLRPLAVTTAERSRSLPDIPTLGEFLPGYEVSALVGFGVARNTPAEIVDTLNREINAGLADPKITARLTDLGGTLVTGSAADYAQRLATEIEKWAKVVKFSGVKPD